MPTVRKRERQVVSEALPGVRKQQVSLGRLSEVRLNVQATPAAFGSEVGNAIEVVGSQIVQEQLRVRDEETRRANQIAVMSADRELSEWENTRLRDPKSGALNRRGRDAFGLPEEIDGEFKTTYGTVRGKLGNDEQREAFDRMAHARRQDIGNEVTRHVFTEIQKYDDAETENYLANARQAALANAADPRRVSLEIERQEAAITDYAERNGLGTEYVKAKTASVRSDTHVAVIDKMLAMLDDKGAGAYYEKVKDQIVGDDTAKIEKILQEGKVRGETQRESDRIIAGWRNDDGSERTLSAALDEAAKIEDAAIRSSVEDRISQSWSRYKQSERDQKEATMRVQVEEIDRIMRDAGNSIDAGSAVRRAVSPADWLKLSIGQKSALEQYAKRNQTGDDETDPGTYYTLMQEAADDPTKFSKRNILESVHKLSKTDFKRIVDLQSNMRSGNREAAAKEIDGFRTNAQIFNDTLTMAGVDVNAKGDAAKQIARLRALVDEQVIALQRSTGGKATNDDIQAIVDGLITKTFTKGGSWWSLLPGGAPLFDQTKPLFEVTIGDIPAGDRIQIEELLRGAKQPVTDDSILDVYIRTQMRVQRK